MDRPIWYTQENLRGYDLSKGAQDVVKGSGKQAADTLGQTITVVGGLSATASSPTSLVVNIGPGSIYQNAVLDPTAAGDLPADGNTYFLQGIAWASTALTLSTAALTSGQSQWALIEATFGFSDVIRASDPNGGVLPFYNSANPTSPLQGQGGSGGTLDTERTAIVSLKVVYGTPATTGSEVPPSADSGYVGLYLIDLAYGQSTIAQNQILTAGPSVGTNVPSNYPYAPFLAGLLNQHHKGTAGQAPQIDLTSEVKNVLPNANTTAVTTATDNTIALRDSAGALTATDFNVSSDVRGKKNLRPLKVTLDALDTLRGWAFDRLSGRKSAGWMAQDFQRICPEGVQMDESGMLTLNPMAAVAVLGELLHQERDARKAVERRLERLERA